MTSWTDKPLTELVYTIETIPVQLDGEWYIDVKEGFQIELVTMTLRYGPMPYDLIEPFILEYRKTSKAFIEQTMNSFGKDLQ